MTYVLMRDYKATGAQKEDCDELINYVREIDTVEIGFFLRQIGAKDFKVSLRSCQYADVAQAAKELNGGGHRMAAGGRVEAESLDAAVEIVLSAVRKQL